VTVHFVLGGKDADILYWKNYLPPKSFAHYIRTILYAERKKEIAVLPVPQTRGVIIGMADSKFVITDRVLIQFVRSFPKGSRTGIIKNIIRKHLDENYRRTLNSSDTPVGNTDDNPMEITDEYRKMLMDLSNG